MSSRHRAPGPAEWVWLSLQPEPYNVQILPPSVTMSDPGQTASLLRTWVLSSAGWLQQQEPLPGPLWALNLLGDGK